MTAVENQRFQMHSAFRQVHGEEVASVIMEHLPPAGWSHLATKDDVALAKSELISEMHRLNAINLRWMIGLMIMVQAAFFAAGTYF